MTIDNRVIERTDNEPATWGTILLMTSVLVLGKN